MDRKTAKTRWISKPQSTLNHIRSRPDRAFIKDEWIQHAVEHPVYEEIQTDGRIRRWAKIKEAHDRYLRVILLKDGKTVHNAFFDRRFKEKQP